MGGHSHNQNNDSSDELPLIKDVDRSKFRHITGNDFLLDNIDESNQSSNQENLQMTKQLSSKQGKDNMVIINLGRSSAPAPVL